jgi:hypothetical protein
MKKQTIILGMCLLSLTGCGSKDKDVILEPTTLSVATDTNATDTDATPTDMTIRTIDGNIEIATAEDTTAKLQYYLSQIDFSTEVKTSDKVLNYKDWSFDLDREDILKTTVSGTGIDKTTLENLVYNESNKIQADTSVKLNIYTDETTEESLPVYLCIANYSDEDKTFRECWENKYVYIEYYTSDDVTKDFFSEDISLDTLTQEYGSPVYISYIGFSVDSQGNRQLALQELKDYLTLESSDSNNYIAYNLYYDMGNYYLDLHIIDNSVDNVVINGVRVRTKEDVEKLKERSDAEPSLYPMMFNTKIVK